MPLNALFHVAIKTANLETTRRFYTEVMGMTIDPSRPATTLDFPGVWLRSPVPGGVAIFHIYAGRAAVEPDGSMARGTGVIDHVSVSAVGYLELRERLRRYEVPWRENVLPTVGLWQLFVYDPSAVLLELTYSAHAEGGEAPTFPEERRYRPAENFFDPAAYRQFIGGAA
jgi:catechol 2,3-dioxygenase-like lactoylglutathione lyase family enzyme